LANDPNEFTGQSLKLFSEKVYDVIDQYINYLPERFVRMYPYMKGQNWLLNYRTKRGTELSFGGLARRARYIEESETATLLFEENYKTLRECYKVFIPDIKSFAHRMYLDIQKL
jgi:acyl carrier protein phosphodiesterase